MKKTVLITLFCFIMIMVSGCAMNFKISSTLPPSLDLQNENFGQTAKETLPLTVGVLPANGDPSSSWTHYFGNAFVVSRKNMANDTKLLEDIRREYSEKSSFILNEYGLFNRVVYIRNSLQKDKCDVIIQPVLDLFEVSQKGTMSSLLAGRESWNVSVNGYSINCRYDLMASGKMVDSFQINTKLPAKNIIASSNEDYAKLSQEYVARGVLSHNQQVCRELEERYTKLLALSSESTHQASYVTSNTRSLTQPLPDNTKNRWAVVVGLSEYANKGQNGLSNLSYADGDAKEFANNLRHQGWSRSNIKLLTNEQATQRNVMIAMESWLTKAGPDDMVVLFWSGHGFPDPADPEKVYFACYDTDIRIPATGYRMDKVRSAVEEIGVRNVVMFADTCHAGKLITRGDEKAIGITPYVDSLVKKKNIPKGWIFMVASDVDRKAIEDSSWSHGAFTHCLLKAMKGEADGYQSAGPEDGIVTMGELRAFMNSAMPDETQRILGVAKRPVITTSTGDPAIWDLSLTVK